MKIKKNYQIEKLEESEALLLVRALQSYSGRWHDTHGFKWRKSGVHSGAQRLHDQLCKQLGLDPNKLVVAQEQ